jgi:hypothetical protein
MMTAVIAEAVIILALVVVLDRVINRWMRSINAQHGIPDVDKPSRGRVISPYKRRKDHGGGDEA